MYKNLLTVESLVRSALSNDKYNLRYAWYWVVLLYNLYTLGAIFTAVV